MWRVGRSASSVKIKKPGKHAHKSNFSTSGSGGGVGKMAVNVATGACLAAAGTTIYAKYNEDFRKNVEYNLPFTKSVFSTMIGSNNAKKSEPVHKSAIDTPSSKLRLPDTLPPEKPEISTEDENILEEQTKLMELNDLNSTETSESKPAAETNAETLVNDNSIKDNNVEPEQNNATESKAIKEETIVERLEPALQEEISSDTSTTTTNKDDIEQVMQSETVVEKESPETVSLEEQQKEKSFFPSTNERSSEEVQHSLWELEKDILADAAATASIIEEELSKCAEKCIESINNSKEAQEAISLHTKLVQVAMDAKTELSAKEKSQQWEDVTNVLEQKTRLESLATASYESARQGILKLRSILKQAKEQNQEKLSDVIMDAEEHLNKMTKEFEETAQKVSFLRTEARVLLQYQELAEHAKEQFRKEMLSVMPDVSIKPGWRGLSNKLSQDDLNALIAHAHRRIDQLQRELAEERSLSSKKVEEAVSAAREMMQQRAHEEATMIINQQKRTMEIELHKKLNEARQGYENEMRLQLKRQAAAHSEHLADVLALRDRQLEEQYNKEIEEKLNEQRLTLESAMAEQKELYELELRDQMDHYQFNLNRAFAQLMGVESAIDGRAHIENESRKAQELWLACEALRVALKYGKVGEPVSLKTEVNAIMNIQHSQDNMASVATTFPQESLERGVFTEETIRQSFNRVTKLCRRLSMVNAERNSLFTYFLSYLKSFLIISSAQIEPPESVEAEELDDTFKLLSYARFCMEHGQIEQATRFMNQLKGEPKRMAEGWLKEARLYLETQQSINALLTMATATNIACNLEE